MKILIVDDDPSSRRVLKQIVTVAEPQSEVVEAVNGEEARAQLARPGHGFDVVFLDLSLPDHHGIDLLTQFRQSPELKDLQFILCTASNDRATVVNAVAAGARHYLVKPPVPALVADKLRQVQIGLKAARLPATAGAETAAAVR